VAQVELQRLVTSAEEASTALLLLPPLEGGLELIERVCSLAVHVSRVVRGGGSPRGHHRSDLDEGLAPRGRLGSRGLGYP
jgi:hypothetical protein